MLNDAAIRAAKPGPKPYKLTDADRLFLLVTSSGGKLWRWSYVFNDKQKGMAFGAWPDVSLAEARSKRDENQAIQNEHRAPIVARKLKKQEIIDASQSCYWTSRPGRPGASAGGEWRSRSMRTSGFRGSAGASVPRDLRHSARSVHARFWLSSREEAHCKAKHPARTAA